MMTDQPWTVMHERVLRQQQAAPATHWRRENGIAPWREEAESYYAACDTYGPNSPQAHAAHPARSKG